MNQEKRKQITVYDLLLPSIKDMETHKLVLSNYECVLPTQKEQRIFVALTKFQSTLSMAVHFDLDTDRYNVVLNEFDKSTPYVKVKVLESWLSYSDKLSESALQCEDGLYQLLDGMYYVMSEQTEFFTSEAAECVKKFAYDHYVDLESGRTTDVANWWGLMHLYASEVKAEDDMRDQDHPSECLRENEKPCHCHDNEADCGKNCECGKDKYEKDIHSVGEELLSATKACSISNSLIAKAIALVYKDTNVMPSKVLQTASELDYMLSNDHDGGDKAILFKMTLLATLMSNVELARQ